MARSGDRPRRGGDPGEGQAEVAGVKSGATVPAKGAERREWEVKRLGWHFYVFFDGGVIGSGSTRESAIAQAEAVMGHRSSLEF